MKKHLALLMLSLLLIPFEAAHAVKWKECSYKVVFRFLRGEGRSKSMGLIDFFLIGSTAGTSVSSTSFASSTGPCKAFGSLESQRAIYIADSMTDLQQQAAQGQGEHLDTLASLYGCTPSRFHNLLTPNYTSIFSQGDPIFIDQNIQGVVHQDQELAQSCYVSVN